ncbi:MAG: O-antigen ligase family protein [Gemmatimonas sp.]
MISLVFYLFIIHSFKINAAQATLTIGLVGVALFSRPLRIAPAMTWYAVFLAWALVTMPVSDRFAVSWDAWFNAFKVWLIMLLIYNAVRTQGQYRLFMLAWLAMFAFYPVRGTLFNFASGNSHFGRYSWNFTFNNFNDLAAITLIPLAFAVDRLRSAEAKWIKLCALAGLVVLPFIVLITQSRGGMLGMAAFFLFMLARSRQRVRMVIALTVVAFGAVMFAPQAVWDRIVGMKALRSTETLDESDSSAQQRWVIMHVAATVAAAHPVVGVGIGAYPYTHQKFALRRAEWAIAQGQRDSHNTYLRVAAENGVLGLALFMMVFITTFNELRKTARSMKGSSDPNDREIAERCHAHQAAMVGLAVCAVFGSLDSMVFPFLLVATAATAVRLPRASTSQSQSPSTVMDAQPQQPRFRGGWRPQMRPIAP